MKWSSKKGFTTVEIIVATTIVLIFAVIAVPLVSHLFENHRLRAAGEGLYQELRLARLEAIRQRTDVKVIFQTGGSWCYGATTATTCDCSIADSCNLGESSYLEHKNVSLSLAGFASDTITFEGIRGLADDSGEAIFTLNSKSIRVHIGRLGNLSICSDDVGGYGSC